MFAGQDALEATPEIGAVFSEGDALAYAVEAGATGQDTVKEVRPWKGEDGARVSGKDGPAVCLECMIHAAETGASVLERR